MFALLRSSLPLLPTSAIAALVSSVAFDLRLCFELLPWFWWWLLLLPPFPIELPFLALITTSLALGRVGA
jgi:hypothetical protein